MPWMILSLWVIAGHIDSMYIEANMHAAAPPLHASTGIDDEESI